MHVAFRVDASRTIGTGHVVRCLTLARQLRSDGLSCRFVMRELDGHLATMVSAEKFPVSLLPAPAGKIPERTTRHAHAHWLEVAVSTDAAETASALRTGPRTDWLVVDHYALDVEWETLVRPHVNRMMIIDDLADRRHDCDLLLDQNLNRCIEDYIQLVPSTSRVLVGPTYALLRPEFARIRAGLTRRPQSEARRALVYFGGTDVGNMTLRTLQAVEAVCGTSLDVIVVAGSLSPHIDTLTSWCRTRSWCHLNLGGADMAHLMATVDITIGAAGTTAWERCCLGLPSAIVVVAENQRSGAEGLARAGAALHAGDHSSITNESLVASIRVLIEQPELRMHLSEASSTLVDGRGTIRAAAAIRGPQLQFRRAAPTDCRHMWRWRNAEQTRRYSRDPALVSLKAHEDWFEKSLSLSHRDLLIAEQHGTPVAVVRFDLDKTGTAEISLYVVPGHEGRGIGSLALTQSLAWLATNRPMVTGVRADVLASNEASHRLFKSAGFRPASSSYCREIHS